MAATPNSERLILRQDYFSDPAAWSALVDLLQDTFSIDIGLQDQFGGPDPTSMPFGYFDETGRCVANFSAFSMPLCHQRPTGQGGGLSVGRRAA